MELETLANFAEIFSAVLVVSGVIFGILEVRHFREQRQETASMEIMRAFQSRDFTRAIHLVMVHEGQCRACDSEEIAPELKEAASLIATTLESIGLMVYRRTVPFRLVQKLMGGTIQACWWALEPYVNQVREQTGRPSVHEWFQWLAERFQEYPEYRDAEGAYNKYRDWRPEGRG